MTTKFIAAVRDALRLGAEVLLSRQHLLNSLKPGTPYENTTIAIKRHSHLCRSCYRALCGWLCRGGIRKHNIPAYCGGIPRAHPADAEATANLRCPATLPVDRATVKGHVFYVYKDEKAGVAYVGREQEYQRYHELAVQQQIAQNYYMAAEMDRAAAFGWYGAWGPRALWW